MGNPVHSRAGSIASPAIACLTAPTAPDTSTRLPNRPTESHRPGPRLSSPACCPADPAPAPLPRTAIGAPNDNQRPPPAPFIGIERGPSRPTALTPCSNPKAAPHRWIRAKPEGERRSQLVVMGKPWAVASVREYYELKPKIWETVTSALATLRADYDVVVIEGAGSPAEVNLKEQDIVNMRVALHADAPVLLVGDIDRGGVFAQLVGTMVLLEPEERALVKGHVINKFRGDPSLLTPGLGFLEERTGVPVAGVIPHFLDIHIPEEDSLGLDPGLRSDDETVVDIAVMRLPHIANFDDFDPLRHESGVRVRYVGRIEEFGEPDLVIIPGSKTTMADLDWLQSQRLAERVVTARRMGTPGYRHLREISDARREAVGPGKGGVGQSGGKWSWTAANIYDLSEAQVHTPGEGGCCGRPRSPEWMPGC